MPEAYAERRLALVIGNNDYDHKSLPDLNNAWKDASDMAAKLKGLGFEVILKLNASEREMNRSIGVFSGRLSGGDTGLVFYAGHGIQSDGRNYLIPSDAEIEIEDDLLSEAITAERFLSAMNNAGVALSVMILDACRDNPLPKRRRSAARGLAVVNVPKGASGTVVLYSAGPGQTAEDGPRGGNGVFTGALLKTLDKPGLKLEEVFKETAKAVARKTNNRQKPWINASLTGDFYFRKGGPQDFSAPSGGMSAEMMFWQSIQNSTDPTDFEDYIAQFPSGTFARLAKRRATELKVASLPKPSFRIEDIDATYVVLKTANLRSEPSAQSKRVGRAVADTGVAVTGRVKGKKWYRIAHAGKTAYVFAPLIKAIDPEELAAWSRVKGSKKAGDFKAFVRSYPDGHFTKLARQQLAGRPLGTAPSAVKPAVGAYFRPGDTFKDCADCPEMVVIPAGSFRMGSSPAERRWAVKQGAKQEWVDWETPRKNVRIGYKFAVGKSEVTKGQYKTFVRDTDRGTGDGCYAFDNGKWNKEASKSWRDPGYSQQDNHPAVCVSWDDAKAYVRWLSRKTGQTYRLLSESEWEYTARAGTETVRYWGHDWENKEGCKYANVADFSDLFDCSDGYKFTSPAKKYRANRFGLHDMLGNVWEWTEDCWHNSYNGAPANGSAWTTGGNCRVRVLRGGSWDVKPRNLRSAYRVRNSTVDRFINLGFRVARTL
jgi:formylglycine-generating enzyme required for sulfatase activity